MASTIRQNNLYTEGAGNNKRKVHKSNTPLILRIEEMLDDNYDFRLNPILARTEFKPKNSELYVLLDERSLNSIFRALHSVGINCNIYMLKSILNGDSADGDHSVPREADQRFRAKLTR